MAVSGESGRRYCELQQWIVINPEQFSDEFETPGRTFYDGDDAYYQAMDFWYGVTQDLEASTDIVFHQCIATNP